MKTDNIEDAVHLHGEFLKQLKKAHADAINARNEFAVLVLEQMLEESAEFSIDLKRALSAATA